MEIGIETRAESIMLTGGGKVTTRKRVAFIFLQGIGTVNLEI